MRQGRLFLQAPAAPLPPLRLDSVTQAARARLLGEIAEERRWMHEALRHQRFCGHRLGTPSGDNVTSWFRRDIAALRGELLARAGAAA